LLELIDHLLDLLISDRLVRRLLLLSELLGTPSCAHEKLIRIDRRNIISEIRSAQVAVPTQGAEWCRSQ
jgi:hypothetical protein